MVETGVLRKHECRWFESIPRDHIFKAMKTPVVVAEAMCKAVNLTHKHSVLEPSAGYGKLVGVIRRFTRDVTAVELNKRAYETGRFYGAKDENWIYDSFTRLDPDAIGRFDRIIMCPPEDSIAHIEHAKNFLLPGGRLIALVQKQFVLGYQCYWCELPDIFEFQGERVICGVICYEHPSEVGPLWLVEDPDWIT